jgi:glutamyl-tRNA synthetase
VAELEPAVRGLAEQEGVGAGRIIHPLRVAVTGLSDSPGIFDVLGLLGRDRTLERIDSAIERLNEMESGAHAG